MKDEVWGKGAGRSSGSPAFCSVSMFWGLVACSATICTNRVRAFWYSSNTGERGKVEQPPPSPPSLPRRHPVGAPVHSSLPCSTWRWLMAPCVGSTLRDPLAPGWLLCVPTLRGNRPEPERSRPLATVGPGRDVTIKIEGRQIEALVPGDSRRVPSGVTSLLTGCGTQVFA